MQFRSASQVKSGTSVISMDCPNPTGLAAGDLIVAAALIVGPTRVINTPAGYTVVQRVSNMDGDSELAVFYRIADGSEGVTTTFSWNAAPASTTGGVIMAAYTGIKRRDNTVNAAAAAKGTGHTWAGPAITTDRTTLLTIIGGGTFTPTNTTTSPAGYTTRQAVSGISGPVFSLGDKLDVAAGVQPAANAAGNDVASRDDTNMAVHAAFTRHASNHNIS